MNNIDNFLGGYQPPPVDALKNFGIDMRQAVDKIIIHKNENKANCNLSFCRYNVDGACISGKDRNECVRAARSVLCLEESPNKQH